MQNLKKIIAMMLMLASVFFIACDKDDDELSPADAKAGLEELNTDMSFYFDEMQTAEGMKAMEALMSLPDPFGGTKKTTENSSVLVTMQNLLTPAYYNKTKLALSSELFPWDENKGYKYEFNGTYFNRVSGTANQIIIEFPSDTLDLNNNDATITIYNYAEVSITNEGYTDYYPTAFNADLEVDNIKYIDVDFTASWAANEEPEALSISVYLNPFTFGGTFSNLGTSASANFEIVYDETLIFAVGAGATFESTNWDNPPLNINGYVQLLNVKVQANANFKSIMAIIQSVDDGTSSATDFEELVAQINAEFDAYVAVDGNKAADVVLVWDETEGQPDVMFEFSDGSLEPALPYFEEFASDIQEFFTFLDGIYI